MPLFEYVCKECLHHFESLVQGRTTPQCPRCRTQNIEKLLSAFAVGGTGGGMKFGDGPGGCGTCGDPRGPGACSQN